ncbi:hypothetical protein BpHYR1_011773 [Brachionus plicatilis]|uniref:Uncharacterized protein n=1 Tax=Brachionus plicatilis TaxID=10195 RepID=A0A3M7Q5L0_BRAPC|nr:hypothetical protein BpHYR1_011773 [Brachionus plicatilis]
MSVFVQKNKDIYFILNQSIYRRTFSKDSALMLSKRFKWDKLSNLTLSNLSRILVHKDIIDAEVKSAKVYKKYPLKIALFRWCAFCIFDLIILSIKN